MSRNHRTRGIIRVLCTDTYHHDTREFAEHGFHYLRTLRMTYRQGSPGPPFTITWRNTAPDKPVKDFCRADGLWVFKFECPCGLDPQRVETYLVELVLQYFGGQRDRRGG